MKRPVTPVEIIERFAARLTSIEEALGESRVVRSAVCGWCGVDDCVVHCRYCYVALPGEENADPRDVPHGPACPYTTGVWIADGTYFCGLCGDPILEGERYGWVRTEGEIFDAEAEAMVTSSWSVSACLDCQAAELPPPTGV